MLGHYSISALAPGCGLLANAPTSTPITRAIIAEPVSYQRLVKNTDSRDGLSSSSAAYHQTTDQLLTNTMSGPDWYRPLGPIKYWKLIDGYEMQFDGTYSPVKMSIQEIPTDRYEEVIEHMCKYFMNDDPVCKSMGMKNDPQKKSDMIELWRYCLQQGLVVGVFTIDYYNRVSRLAAVNMLLVLTNYSGLCLRDTVQKFSYPSTVRLFKLHNELALKADVCKMYGVDKYLYACGLSVAPEYRGQKLGQRLLEVRTDIGRYYGIKVTMSMFTSMASQILAERAGFKTIRCQYYKNMVYEDGTPVYPGIESPQLLYMAKKLE